MQTPKVSVIVPIYNVSKYIERCARSLFDQTLLEIEYIFVDDCSPDNSIEILKSIISQYPQRVHQIKIVKHEINMGLASARNTGLKEATGSYVVHCDSDDWADVEMYEIMYMTAVQTNSDIVGCDYFMHFKDYNIRCEAISENNDKNTFLKTYISYNWSVIWNLMVRREIYVNNEVWEYPGLNFGEDYGLSVRLMYYANKYLRINRPLYHYNRENNDSIVHNANTIANIKKTTESLVNIYDNISNFFKEKGMYEILLEQLSWRMLSGKRGWLYITEQHEIYRTLYPESNRFINSNPFCSKKDKFCQKIILIPALSWLLKLVKIVDTLIK